MKIHKTTSTTGKERWTEVKVSSHQKEKSLGGEVYQRTVTTVVTTREELELQCGHWVESYYVGKNKIRVLCPQCRDPDYIKWFNREQGT